MGLGKNSILSPLKLATIMLIIGCASLSNVANASWFRRCMGTLNYKCCAPNPSLPQGLQEALSKCADSLLNNSDNLSEDPGRGKPTTRFAAKASEYLGEPSQAQWAAEVNLICAILDDDGLGGIVARISCLLQAWIYPQQGITSKALRGVAVLLALSLMEVVDSLELNVGRPTIVDWEVRKTEWEQTIVGKAILTSLQVLKSAAVIEEVALEHALKGAAKEFFRVLEADGPGEITSERPVIALADSMAKSYNNLCSILMREEIVLWHTFRASHRISPASHRISRTSRHLWGGIIAFSCFGNRWDPHTNTWVACLMEFLQYAGKSFHTNNSLRCHFGYFNENIHRIMWSPLGDLRQYGVNEPDTIDQAKKTFEDLANLAEDALGQDPTLVPTEEMWAEWQEEWNNAIEGIRKRYRSCT